MSWTTSWLLAGLVLAGGSVALAGQIEFAGYTWAVRSGQGGPGPNLWDEHNVWLDASTNLHLKISQRDGKWSCAELTLQTRLGLGQYQFQITGRLDRFDYNVVLGLFNYPTANVGPDGTHEIDIEFARWGQAKNPLGNYTVWPVRPSLRQATQPFRFASTNEQTTHRFTWSHETVTFQSVQGYREDDRERISSWIYNPSNAAQRISQQPMPVHINLWLFRGLPPKDGREVEVIIHDFKFTRQ